MRKANNALVIAALFTLLLVTASASVAGAEGEAGARSGEVSVLAMMCTPYGLNYNLIQDVMDLYGWNVTTIAVSDTVNPCADGSPIVVDTLVTEVDDLSAWDCLFIMPARAYTGTSHADLLASPEALDLVARADSMEMVIGTVCGGVRVLAAADILSGVTVTGHLDYKQEYLDAGAIWAGDVVPPVVDGRILTTRRGQYYRTQICEALRRMIDDNRAAR
ncbi:MAG: DJ-1/PfpI family protein [Candidatus Eisenbacteria bacterium]|nr:DJ-1/PfpI family protein [Candidatus Eisenbacteria bacterium]